MVDLGADNEHLVQHQGDRAVVPQTRLHRGQRRHVVPELHPAHGGRRVQSFGDEVVVAIALCGAQSAVHDVVDVVFGLCCVGGDQDITSSTQRRHNTIPIRIPHRRPNLRDAEVIQLRVLPPCVAPLERRKLESRASLAAGGVGAEADDKVEAEPRAMQRLGLLLGVREAVQDPAKRPTAHRDHSLCGEVWPHGTAFEQHGLDASRQRRGVVLQTRRQRP
mmetsp:Transcript_56319/g.132725  ORF Transcript_56319/g.132725 Transcript_56319/m.132725 type:complete len:220 (-) Transcript_56319:78-737(-)